MLTIPHQELSRFRATDREQCAIMVGNIEGEESLIDRLVEVPNVAEDPTNDYGISKADFESVKASLRPDEVIIGFFHTHLASHLPYPSDTDFDGAEIHPEFLNCIYHQGERTLTWYGSLTEGTPET